jgi:hypothetical protein
MRSKKEIERNGEKLVPADKIQPISSKKSDNIAMAD